MTPITPIQNTNNIRYADFVRIVTPTAEYRFSTAPTAITVSAVDSQPFDGLGQLIGIGKVQRDIKSTANQTTITLIGIDTALLGVVLNGNLKGSQITMWKGFFNPDGTLKSASDWQATGVTIREGASIGARSVCVAPVEIGAWALVAAGSTVVKNVPAFALVAGTPAKRIRWVGKAGVPLEKIGENQYKCPKTGALYKEVNSETLVAE